MAYADLFWYLASKSRCTTMARSGAAPKQATNRLGQFLGQVVRQRRRDAVVPRVDVVPGLTEVVLAGLIPDTYPISGFTPLCLYGGVFTLIRQRVQNCACRTSGGPDQAPEMFCQRCQDIANAGSQEAEKHSEQAYSSSSSPVMVHHPDWTSFEDAVSAGCHLCNLIHEGLVTDEFLTDVAPRPTRIYWQAHTSSSTPSAYLIFSPSMYGQPLLRFCV